MAQGGRQIVALVQGTVRIVGVGRLHRQFPLPPHHILLFQVLVRLFEGLQARYPHPFHQAILGGLEIPLHASLRLSRQLRLIQTR